METPVVRSYDGHGITVAADHRGDHAHPPVVFLHGGGQTRHSWAGSASALATRGWHAVTLDLRGHGETDWAPDADYRLSSFAADVRQVIAALEAPPVVVGASLGGMTAIYLAGLLAPGSCRAVVLVDVIPELHQPGTDRIRDFMVSNMDDGFASLDEVADVVAGYNPHRPRSSDTEGLKKNLRLRDGRWYWHWDPAFMNRGGGQGLSEMLDFDLMMGAVRAIGVPMMLVRGRMSDVVSEEGVARFLAEFPHVEFVDVSDAGHMVAGDRNDVFTEAVVSFLERLEHES